MLYYQGFTLNADSMDSNATGFTYTNGAPTTGPVARFSAGGNYDMWLNAAYSGGNTLFFRTRNGDSNSNNNWRALVSYGVNSYGDTIGGTVYYDANDTGYYIDPNSNSRIYGNLTFGAANPTITASSYITFPGGAYFSGGTVYTEAAIQARGGISNDSGAALTLNGGTGGYTNISGSARSPIFYDSNDTSYYCNPNSDSVFAGKLYIPQLYINSTNFGDNINGSSWYGLGVSNIGGAIGGTMIQLANYYGLRIRSNSSILEIDGPNFGNSWLWANSNFAVAGQNRGTIFYDYSDTAYYCDPNSVSYLYQLHTRDFLYLDNNYGHSIVGAYNSYAFQGVFAMGDSYKTTAGGGINNLYGMCWSHPNAGGIAGNLDSHGMIVAINGGFGSCMSYSIKASGNVTAYSDERLKKDWADLPKDFVTQLAKVKVGTYTRIDGEKKRQVGISAQSLRPLMPDAVIEADDDFKTLSVAYGNAAMASTVELAKEVVSLKEQLVEALERLNKLENK